MRIGAGHGELAILLHISRRVARAAKGPAAPAQGSMPPPPDAARAAKGQKRRAPQPESRAARECGARSAAIGQSSRDRCTCRGWLITPQPRPATHRRRAAPLPAQWSATQPRAPGSACGRGLLSGLRSTLNFVPIGSVAAGVGGSVNAHHRPAQRAGQVQRARVAGNKQRRAARKGNQLIAAKSPAEWPRRWFPSQSRRPSALRRALHSSGRGNPARSVRGQLPHSAPLASAWRPILRRD